jgi:hypothetical protein
LVSLVYKLRRVFGAKPAQEAAGHGYGLARAERPACLAENSKGYRCRVAGLLLLLLKLVRHQLIKQRR